MASAAAQVEVRELRGAGELASLPDFERELWGTADGCTPVEMLVACVEEGGLALGAFAAGRLVGSAFGFRTHQADTLHSHYLGVAPSHRGLGVGELLKRQQAQWCLARDLTTVRWTFDPLQLTNAHLNLNKLGAAAIEYRFDHYGPLAGINGGLPSDRLLVSWRLSGGWPRGSERCTVDVPVVTREQVARGAPEALAARVALRESLASRLDDGWRVVSLDRMSLEYGLVR